MSLRARIERAAEWLLYGALAAGFVLSILQVWHVEQPKKTGQRVQIDFLWPTYTPQKVRYGEYLAREYMRLNPDIYVNLVLTPDPYPKLQVMIAGRTAPDVVWMGIGWQQFVDSLKPLDDLIAKDPEVGPDNYPPAVWDGVKWDGKVYCVPSGAQTAVIYYNKDLFRDAGIETPTPDWTWDDMVRMAKALTRDFDGDGVIEQYGLQLEQVYRVPFMQYVQPVADPSWTRAQIDHPATVAIMDAYRDLVYKHHVMPTPTASAELGMLPMFEAGRMGMHAASAYAIESFRKTPFDWDVVSMPWFEWEGKRYRGTGLWEEEFAVLADTDVPEEAWKFARWCASREVVRWSSEEGHIVPARLDVAYSDAFLTPNMKPKSARVFLDSWAFASSVYQHPWWKRIAVDFEPIFQQWMVGTDGRKIDTAVAMRRLDEALQQILDDYRSEK